MTSNDIFLRFTSRECAVCKRRKSPNTAFCAQCYAILPRSLRADLWERFGAGFEEAYERALAHLEAGKAQAAGAAGGVA